MGPLSAHYVIFVPLWKMRAGILNTNPCMPVTPFSGTLPRLVCLAYLCLVPLYLPRQTTMPGFVGCELIRIALPLSLIDSLGRIRMRGDGRRGGEEIKVLMLEIKLSILISTRPVFFSRLKSLVSGQQSYLVCSLGEKQRRDFWQARDR